MPFQLFGRSQGVEEYTSAKSSSDNVIRVSDLESDGIS